MRHSYEMYRSLREKVSKTNLPFLSLIRPASPLFTRCGVALVVVVVVLVPGSRRLVVAVHA